MSNNNISNTSSHDSTFALVGLIIYLLTVISASFLLLFPPDNFDAKAMILPIVILLFVGGIGIGRKFTKNSENKFIAMLGNILIAVMLTFIGFFVVSAVAWFIGVAAAQ